MEGGKRRKHLPGEVRPARPARWEREACEQGVVTRASMPVRGLKERSCESYGSAEARATGRRVTNLDEA